MELAFDVDKLDDVAARIRGFLEMQTPQGLFDKMKMLPKLMELGSFFPKVVKDGACQEVVRRETISTCSISHSEMLAARRRPLYHFPARFHQESSNRQAQRWHVPHAGI